MKFFHDSYRQKFDIILFVYDITNFNSLLYVKTHMEKFSDSPYWPRKPLGVLVSTKSDLIHKR